MRFGVDCVQTPFFLLDHPSLHHSILTAITFITLDTRGLTSRLDLSHTSTVASLRSSQTRKAKSAAQFVKAESRAPHGFLPITTRLCIGR